jgi:hypothetical protein
MKFQVWLYSLQNRVTFRFENSLRELVLFDNLERPSTGGNDWFPVIFTVVPLLCRLCRDVIKLAQCLFNMFCVRCMVAHCSDMQDLSRHTIPRHLQDTEVPLYPQHYSYSSNYYTGLIIPMLYQCQHYQCCIYPSLSRRAIPRRLQDTALPLHLAITPLSLDSSCRTHQYQYRWPCYCIYAPIPRHWTHSLTTPGPRI